MSIEQTSQLISLILNSVLMTLLSAGLLGGAWLRQNGLSLQLQQLQKQYKRLAHHEAKRFNEAVSAQERSRLKTNLKKIRERRQRLLGQYRWSYVGMLLLHGVLLVFGVSVLALALRSLFLYDSLISAALVLFTLGVVGLIAGISCVLIDIAQGDSGGDELSYSLAKVLSQLAKRWQRSSGRRASKPLSVSLAPLFAITSSMQKASQQKKLPGSTQKPDSFT